MDKETVIDQIIEVEKEMFLAVNTEEECSCQDNIERFGLHRKVQFIAWDVDTLKHYLSHISEKWAAGENLMTIKYARMENKISPYSNNPLIPQIAKQSALWQQEVVEKYPGIMSKARPLEEDDPEKNIRSFITYLSCELETYSDKTLESLALHQQKKLEEGINLSIVSYEFMVQSLGYEGLDHAEKRSGINK